MYDIIGTIYSEDEEPVALPGWHVNSPFAVVGWEEYQVEPNSPRRVFAGHPTFCYVFPDEATYEAIVNPPQPEPVEE
jgi:hypothetical protein